MLSAIATHEDVGRAESQLRRAQADVRLTSSALLPRVDLNGQWTRFADELAIGVVNNKTTAVRLIPVPGGKAGDLVEFGGLLGSAPVMPVNPHSAAEFMRRGGRLPAPVTSLRN